VSKIICPICNEELFFSLKTVGEGKVTEDGKLSITLAVDIDDIEKHFEKHKDYETESVSGYLGKPPNVMSPSPLLNEKDLNGAAEIMERKTIVIHTDGACSGNPGPGAAGYKTIGKTCSGSKAFYFSHDVTNNMMEYQGVLIALVDHVKFNGDIVICSDSELVVNQINGMWEVKDDKMFILQAKCLNGIMKREINGFKTIIRHIPREENKAHNIVKMAMDSKGNVCEIGGFNNGNRR